MTQPALHLVDRYGIPVPGDITVSLERAFRWAQWQFPLIDTALLATWTEDLATSMAERSVQSLGRYAVAALHNRIREYFRAGGLQETTVGASHDLELLAGVEDRSAKAIERSILFDQLRTQLSERDRIILVLLRQDITSPMDIANSLGVSYDAAAKAIQRVRERLRDILLASQVKTGPVMEVQQ
jgi:RNA polymerase sigma factor (sigma-70 family)